MKFPRLTALQPPWRSREYGALLVVSLLCMHTANSALLFREDWAEIPFALPITQEHVANSDLTLHLYGGAVEGLKKSHHDEVPNDPYYVWSGEITSSWIASLSHSGGAIDVSRNGRVRWLTRQSGDHALSIVLKRADGSWLISEELVDASDLWIETTHHLSEIDWDNLLVGDDIQRGSPVTQADLSDVVEIGFTDLKAGASSPSSSRVDWIEVYVDVDSPLCGIHEIALSEGSCVYDSTFVLDGNFGTRWFSEGVGSYVSAELNRELSIDGVDIAWYRGAERIAFFEVQVSLDGENWSTALESTASSGATDGFEGYPFEPTSARFVRILCARNEVNDCNSITELRLRGRELTPAWWESETVRQVLGEWRHSDWIGWIWTENAPWVYNPELGWFYCSAPAVDNLWIWDPRMKWLWTNEATFPFLYRHADATWLWFDGGPEPRWFFNLNTGEWEEQL